MILSDNTIIRLINECKIVIEPLNMNDVQPASVDVHLSNEFRKFTNYELSHIDVKQDTSNLTELVVMSDDKPFMLHPGEFVLASTVERVEIPDHIVSRLEGKSSLARLGLVIHSTAGFIDPGWKGPITLELSNNARLPITLYPGMKIGQLSFLWLTTPADRPYGSPGLGSKYQNQQGPTASKISEEF